MLQAWILGKHRNRDWHRTSFLSATAPLRLLLPAAGSPLPRQCAMRQTWAGTTVRMQWSSDLALAAAVGKCLPT